MNEVGPSVPATTAISAAAAASTGTGTGSGTGAGTTASSSATPDNTTGHGGTTSHDRTSQGRAGRRDDNGTADRTGSPSASDAASRARTGGAAELGHDDDGPATPDRDSPRSPDENRLDLHRYLAGAKSGRRRPRGFRDQLRAREPAARRRWFLQVGGLTAATGVLVALLGVPLVGGVAMIAKSSADHFMNLPSELLVVPPPQSSVVLAADGTEIARLRGTENRVVVPAGTIPQVMRDAIVAIEDNRFYTHNGFDTKGLVRAALSNSEAGEVTQGGSTLTQQYVKNVLLQTATTPEEQEEVAGASVDRKLRELRYAVELEKVMTKDQILVGYLNIAYFGDGAYGVGTAAQHFFGIDVSELNLAQAALLAGLVQSPSRFDPVNHPEAGTQRRDMVLDRMVAEHYVTPEQAEAAKQTPVQLAPTVTAEETGDSCATSAAPFFCDYVRKQLLDDPTLGADKAERSRRILEGGLTIQTTLDPATQLAAQQAVDTTVPRDNRVSVTEVVVQPGTGNVLAMAVNRTFGDNTAANETKVALPLATGFQVGSTFKTFTLAAALEDGYGTNTTFYSPSCYESDVYVIGDNSGRDEPDPNETATCEHGFSNAEPAEQGYYDMVRATEDSVNTYFIQLQERVTVPKVVDMAVRLGVPQGVLAAVGPNDGSLTLGSIPVSPLDMANSYATLAAHGLRCTPRALTGIQDSLGNVVEGSRGSSCEQTVSPEVADSVTEVLSHVITSGTGYPNAYRIGRPAAGKTGTTDGFSSAWFVGYTPQMAAAVVSADPIAPVENPLRGVVTPARTYTKVFGGDISALVWGDTMRAALTNQPVVPLPEPDRQTIAGTKGGILSQDPNPPPPVVVPDPFASPGLPGAPVPGQQPQPGLPLPTLGTGGPGTGGPFGGGGGGGGGR